MSKSGVTNTLQESLMLEARMAMLYDAFDKEQNVKSKELILEHIKSIKKRLYKLPNYNVNGLTKLMKFFKIEGGGYAKTV
jgi:hypothetical protein